MKKISFIVTISLVLLTFGVVFAQTVKYDFDEVEVNYAAKFTAVPVRVSPDAWIVNLTGGVDKPVTVIFGVVKLKKNGVAYGGEEFIKVSGENGSERFLLNSAGFDYYPGNTNYSEIKSFFWSAKKLIDNAIVKDFTLPINSIYLLRGFDEAQKLTSVTLSFSNDGQKAAQEFWISPPSRNIYKVDLGESKQAGDPVSKVGESETIETKPETKPAR